jgi:hypothetical protein
LTLQERKSLAANFAEPGGQIIRVRALGSGKVGWFIVTESYRGSMLPFEMFTRPVMSGISCGPDRVSWLSTGVIRISVDGPPHPGMGQFRGFANEQMVDDAIRLGLLRHQMEYTTSWMWRFFFRQRCFCSALFG